jgi:iron complex outermembrane receptor protein
MAMNWVSGARRAMLASICISALAISGQALAQDAPPPADPAPGAEVPTEGTAPPASVETQDTAAQGSDQEIVVTARRRNEVLQDVPIAVTAYSSEQLDRQGALDITDISDTTPNVNLETSRGTNTTLTAFIRGVGQQDPVAGFEQGVGIYLDDVYLNRPQGALLDIYDVERIEILRGPQGTLYGRNTIGGAVKYVTRRLSDVPTGSVRANIGSAEQLDVVVSASTPLGDAFKVGAAAARITRGGFGKNLTTGDDNYNKDIFATRGTIEVEPSENVFVRLAGDYTWDNSKPRGGHRLIPSLIGGFAVLDDVFDSRGGLTDPTQKVKGGGVSLFGEFGVTDWLKLRSITSYRKDRSETPIDFDATPLVDLDVPAIYRNRQFSQEVQGVIESDRLAGVVGFYYLNANAKNIFDVRLYTLGALLGAPGFTASTAGDVDTKTWAGFGDFTYDVSDQFSVSAGIRYTSDKRHAIVLRQNRVLGGQPGLGGSSGFGVGTVVATTSNFDGRRKDTAWTPRFSIAYKPNRDHNIYASYSRGFKGGGFDPRGQTTNAPGDTPTTPPTAEQIYDFMAFDPETVDSYELGWKGSAINRRLRWALAVFQANYKDVQVPGSSGCTTLVAGVPVTSFCGITTNAGKARFRGVELETNAVLAEDLGTSGDRLNFAGSLGYLDAKYLEFLAPVTPGQPPIDVADHYAIQNTPKWTLSGGLDYDTPAFGGRINFNTTLSYRSKSQQFERPSPGLDQKGFALWDANIVWRAPGNRFTVGLHGKNLTDKEYVVSGYNFLTADPLTGAYILNAAGNPIPAGGLGQTGVLTAFYGNPRQVWLSLGASF